MDAYVKVHPKYMVVIPKEVREQAHIGIGDKLVACFRKGEVVLTPTRVSDAEKRVMAIRQLRHIYDSKEKVPDEIIFDPLEYADPDDLR